LRYPAKGDARRAPGSAAPQNGCCAQAGRQSGTRWLVDIGQPHESTSAAAPAAS